MIFYSGKIERYEKTMIESSYVIRGRRFFTQKEYEAGLRDVEKIDSLRKRMDLEDPETASRVYQQLIGFPDMFETYLGDEFLHQLQQCASGKPAGEWLLWREPREKLPIDQDIWGRKRKSGKKLRRKQTFSKSSKKSNTKRNKKIFLVLVSIVLGCIILYQVGYSIYYQVASYLSERKIANLISCILEPVEGYIPIADRQPETQIGSLPKQGEGEISTILYKYSTLYERNSDLVGWISIEGTVINYPVMQSVQDEEFYLKRDFDKNNDINGLPFMDIRNSITSHRDNWIIYGHNMKNGSMFSTLLKYKEKEFFDTHRTFRFDTIYEEGEYEIIAVVLTEVGYPGDAKFRYYRFHDLSEKEQFEEYLSGIQKLSIYDTGGSAEYGDQLVTLSTCDRSIEDGRFIIVGRKISDFD